MLLEAAACFDAVHVRHQYVEQDQVGLGALGDRQRPLAGRGDIGLITLFAHQLAQQLKVGRRIVDNQNGGFMPLGMLHTAWTHCFRPSRCTLRCLRLLHIR
ncbi:hypothetical protein D3C72_1823730 [compost metagenome]